MGKNKSITILALGIMLVLSMTGCADRCPVTGTRCRGTQKPGAAGKSGTTQTVPAKETEKK